MANREPPLPGFDDRAPRDRYCDLVLTGGVTSAIAYPAAIFALATAYRFNSIGGSSSGGGAAALAAAAEYRRRNGSSDGFRLLLERTDAVAQIEQGRTGLEWLFQPEPGSERLFRALVPGFAKADEKGTALLGGLFGAYARVPLVAGLGLAGVAGVLAAIWYATCVPGVPAWAPLLGAGVGLLLLVLAVVAALFTLARDLTGVAKDDFGLCSGLARLPDAPRPTLTEWLHGLIQEIAGRAGADPPLTFSDLAHAPGSPRETLGDQCAGSTDSINLKMFTANVTHGRPYLLPQREEDPDLYFRPAELRRLFPESVVHHMRSNPLTHASTRYTGEVDAPPPRPPPASGWRWPWRSEPPAGDPDDQALYRLPKQHLPIVVAARMSVSFPILFSAVPLWTLDPLAKPPRFRRCLFSDGGLCSNFPIHLFDSAVPAWPTFGITLFKSDAASMENPHDPVILPEYAHDEAPERWNDFDDRAGAKQRWFGFASALLATTKDWNDAALARLPGVRDRVAPVGLASGIGGLNILMDPQQIRYLGWRGAAAARALLARFAKASGPSGLAEGWNEHRWVRFNVLRDALARHLAGLSWSAGQDRHAGPLREQIRRAGETAPLRSRTAEGSPRPDPPASDPPLLAAEVAALHGALAALTQAEHALNASVVVQPPAPCPRPDLRIRPPL